MTLTQKEAQQQVLTKVWDHFITNRQPLSIMKVNDPEKPHIKDRCVYFRESDGARCAIGCLLDPTDAKTLPPQQSVRHIMHRLPLDIAAAGPSFLLEVQYAHDGAARDCEDPKGQAKTLARRLGYLFEVCGGCGDVQPGLTLPELPEDLR